MLRHVLSPSAFYFGQSTNDFEQRQKEFTPDFSNTRQRSQNFRATLRSRDHRAAKNVCWASSREINKKMFERPQESDAHTPY
jgi:hypothetical protein